MAIEPKGAYNRAPIFTGENYDYQKAFIRIHINPYDKGVWDAIINGPTQITVTDANGVVTPKSEVQ